MTRFLLLLLSLSMTFIVRGVSADSISALELQELTVEGDRILHMDGHEILLLDSRNRNFGTNALDAVSSLPRFITTLNGTELTSWNHSAVFILINGVPSTAIDLRSYKGSDIKKVEYYSSPPSQYMGFTDGPLVNVVIKKRHDRLYSGYLNALNSVTTGYGTDQIDLSYSDSLNQVKAGYLLDYRDIGNIFQRSEYEFLPAWASRYDNIKRYKGAYHSIYGSYQHYRTSHLFNVRLKFLARPDKQTSSGEITAMYGDAEVHGIDSTLLRTDSKSLSLDIYYSHFLRNGSVLAVNVVNTIGRGLSQSVVSSPDAITVGSRTDNRSYSLVANAFYSSKALGWNYVFGSKYEYQSLSQEYSDTRDRRYSHREFLSLGLSRTFGDWNIVPSVGLNVLARSECSEAKTYVLPYLRMYADWWPEGSLRGFSTQLTLLSRHSAPSLGMLTDSYIYKDYHFLAVGNPDLRNYMENSAKLAVCYFVPGKRDQITLMGQTVYMKDPIASTLAVADGIAYLQPSNLHNSFRHRIDLNVAWYPWRWIEVSPYVEYYIHRYDASSHVRESYLRYGGTVTATAGQFTFILAANSPTRDFDGDLTIDGSAQYAAIVQYKHGDWSVGAEYHYSGHNNRSYGDAGRFNMIEESDWRPLQTMVHLTATYSFSVGRARRHGSRMLNETGELDNGLNIYNTPVKPK